MDPHSSNSPASDPVPSIERRTLRVVAAVLPRSLRQRQIHEWQDHLTCTRENGGDTRRELLSLARSTAPIAWNAHIPRYRRVSLHLLAATTVAALLFWTPGNPGSNETIPTVAENAAILPPPPPLPQSGSDDLLTAIADFVRREPIVVQRVLALDLAGSLAAEVDAVRRLTNELFGLDYSPAKIKTYLRRLGTPAG
jgi:hypothetical protein